MNVVDAATAAADHSSLDATGHLSVTAITDIIKALPTADAVQKSVERYSMLADPTRLTLLLCIRAAGEVCVSDLTAATGVRSGTVSQALRLLRAQGVVSSRRVGRLIYYTVRDDSVRALLDGTTAD